MISRSELSEIGHIAKTHGVAGELRFAIPYDIDLEELSCVILDMDGIYVPFFTESIRGVGADSCLVTLDGIDSEDEASELVGKTIYALSRELPESDEEGLYAEDMLGFSATSTDGLLAGEIVEVDTSTDNVLLVVRTIEGKRVLIPLADELISRLDPEKKEVEFILPEGLLDLKM